MKRILGVDPGSRITGYGILETRGSRIRLLDHGVVRTREREFTARLGEIFTGLAGVVEEWIPTEMAIENVFVHRNAASALKLGQARGAAICAGVQGGLAVSEYSPTEIKQAVVGTGRADKAQVQHMVTSLMGIDGKPQADAADAMAVALCHFHTSGTLARADSMNMRWGRRRR